ncbi:hypothetical protein [Halorussus caseinilyticus]|uniref:Uncharacterized protein n=1 Tax=Halorussus caseinilyticus TaxID=3034025 RepID=A0ABD5WPI4_9EURY|nr:hypothetical protein [Halorussus sp. DT72]
MADSDELPTGLDRLGKRLDRITYLLVALLVLQVVHVFGGNLVHLSLVALLALAAAFVLLVALGLARSVSG